MADSNSNNWKQALIICKQYHHLNSQEAIQAIKKLGLNGAIKDKAIKLISRLNDDHALLDKDNLTNIAEILQSKNNLVGQTIGDYKVISLIAKGGMSSVYSAQKIDTSIKKTVALKILSHHFYSDKSLELFNREQLILSQLPHANIVSFHHSGQTQDGTNYMVMEFIDKAKTIVDYCDYENFNTKQIIGFIMQLATVFTYAHNNLIIHRDIKPSNILIDQCGTLKVIDFGIAQIISDKQSDSTQVFTLDSASPEQLLGKNVTIQTDVFSLAIVLLQLLVKQEPLPKTILAQYNPNDDTQHIKKLLRSSQFDTDLKNIIICATHVDLSQRYLNMELFAQDLNHWLNNKPIHATSDSALYRIKKFVLRNPLAVALSSFIFIALFIGLIIIQNLASIAQEEVIRANKTLGFLTHILDQTDSFQSNIANITLKQALDLSSEIPLHKLGGDQQLKKTLHLKLADIYYNMAHDNSAIDQFDRALVILNKNPMEYELEIIKTNFKKAQTMIGLGLLKQSIELNQQMLATLESKYPKNYNLLTWGYANLIKANVQSNSGEMYNADKVHDYTPRLLKLLNQNQWIDSESELYALDVLTAVARNNKHFDLIEKYILKSLKILEEQQQHHSVSYYIFKLNLGYNYISQNRWGKAEEIMLDLISQLESKDPTNYFLSRVYENYASLMFKKGQQQQTLAALTQAVKISKNNQNNEGIYLSLSKRAMYYVRYNHYKAGLADQLELLPVLINQSGKENPRTQSHLVNLALMLYAINQADLANQVMGKAIQLSANHNSRNIRALYHVIAGLSNWHANLKEAAEQNLMSANEYGIEMKNTKYKILYYLINQDKQDQVLRQNTHEIIHPYPQSSDFYESLLYLLHLNQFENLTEQNLINFNQLCQLNEPFIKSKIISLKQLFLAVCTDHYQRSAGEVPSEITKELYAIAIAIKKADQIPKKKLKNQVSDILKSVK